jgi:hypothetical protein
MVPLVASFPCLCCTKGASPAFVLFYRRSPLVFSSLLVPIFTFSNVYEVMYYILYQIFLCFSSALVSQKGRDS